MRRRTELMQAGLLLATLGYLLAAVTVLTVVELGAPEVEKDPTFEVSRG